MYKDDMTRIRAAAFGLAAALVGLSALATAAAADLQTRHRFEIPAQALDTALLAFSDQAKVQVLMWAGLQSDAKSSGATGELRALDALKAILDNTGLVFQEIDEETVAIVKPGTSGKASTGALDAERTSFRVAQIGSQSGDQENAREQQATENSDAQPSLNKTELEEILVTGSHIRGAEELSAPTLVFSREDIQRQGYSTLPELFQSLPQNLSEISPTGALGGGTSRVASSNSHGASGVSLRGLGPGSTLVLLNGQRRPGNVHGKVFDVSAIPVSAIDRIEIVTGGHSAIYGSDAVAGVVNIVTRHDFSGAESHLNYGGAEAGAERLQLSQTFGRHSQSGGFVAAYDYSNDKRLDATQAGVARISRFGLLVTPDAFDLSPEVTRHSGLFSGSLLFDDVDLSIDGLYTQIKSESAQSYTAPAFPGFSVAGLQRNLSEEYSVSPALRARLGGSWQIAATGVYGKTIVDSSFQTASDTTRFPEDAELSSLGTVVDGTIWAARGARIKGAFGAESRWESFDEPASFIHESRKIRSAFAEFLLGLLPSDRNALEDVLQFSLSGRYSDYSDFGDSLNPQFGVRWSPLSVASIRASYASAFRAPDLANTNDANQQAGITVPIPDPLASAGASPLLVRSGNNAQLQPEEAKTWSLGVEYAAQGASRIRTSIDYFEIDYDDRIDVPATDLQSILVNADQFPGLIGRSVSEEELRAIVDTARNSGGFFNESGVAFDPDAQDILSVFPGLVVFDNRFNNVAVEKVKGLDLMLAGSLEFGSASLPFGLNGTYYISIDRQIATNSPFTNELDVPGKPVKFRARGNIGWVRGQFAAYAYLNYTDNYRDPNTLPQAKVDSWFTTDVALRFSSSGAGQHAERGFGATLSVRNLFNREPPLILSNTFGISFDPTNADALRRYISLDLVQRW